MRHRWDLSTDQVEKDALTLQTSNCENVTIEERTHPSRRLRSRTQNP